MARKRYSTEIRGDGKTREWTLPHNLHHPGPTIHLTDVAGEDVTESAGYRWPSEWEVHVTFSEPPPAGRIYHIEITA